MAEAAPDNLTRLVALMRRGEFDVIAIGRALLANPDWVARVRDGRAHALRPLSREMLDTLA